MKNYTKLLNYIILIVQKLLKEIPLFLIASMFGVFGFILPSEKPLIASLPKSSAMMKRIFGDAVFGTSILVSSFESFEQEKMTKTIDNNKTDFILFIL